jgi:hypothetical protein
MCGENAHNVIALSQNKRKCVLCSSQYFCCTSGPHGVKTNQLVDSNKELLFIQDLSCGTILSFSRAVS